MAEQADKIIRDFAPLGWSVFEVDCVNCGTHWVAVIPFPVTPSECPTCGQHPEILQIDFSPSE